MYVFKYSNIAKEHFFFKYNANCDEKIEELSAKA